MLHSDRGHVHLGRLRSQLAHFIQLRFESGSQVTFRLGSASSNVERVKAKALEHLGEGLAVLGVDQATDLGLSHSLGINHLEHLLEGLVVELDLPVDRLVLTLPRHDEHELLAGRGDLLGDVSEVQQGALGELLGLDRVNEHE